MAEGVFVFALFHVDQPDTAEGLVGFFHGGGFLIEHQGFFQFGTLHGHGGQPHVGRGALGIVAGGLAVVFLGLVKIAHEKIALAQFLIDFVIQLVVHVVLPMRLFPTPAPYAPVACALLICTAYAT